MTLINNFDDGFKANLFEALAAIGLGVNALVVSESSPLTGEYLHLASFMLFGTGVCGIAIIHSLRYANRQSKFRNIIAVYGGLILGVSSSAVFGFLTVFSEFNNLLAVLLIAGLSVFYVLMWSRFSTYQESDYWFSG
jgi:heme A synthase